MRFPEPHQDPYFSDPGAGEQVNTDLLAGLYAILAFLLLALRRQNS